MFLSFPLNRPRWVFSLPLLLHWCHLFFLSYILTQVFVGWGLHQAKGGGDRHRLNSPLLPWQQCSVNNVNYCNSPLMYGSTGETRSEVSVADAIWEFMRLLLKSFVGNKLYFSTIGYCQLSNKRKRHVLKGW